MDKAPAVAKDWISAYPSGGKVHPLTPDPREFRIKDIAHALSMQCRYAGHVRRFYSVAEHSVHVSRVVEARATCSPNVLRCVGRNSWGPSCSDLVRWGLIHDASEYALNDVTRPVKHQAELAGYRAAEDRLQSAIAVWLGLDPDEPELVRQVDNEILGTEARQLKAPVDPDWGAWFPGGVLPAAIPGVRVGVWTPAQAKRAFLARFHRLFPEHKE